MAFNIGVNVLEVEGQAVPTIVAAPVSIAGFLVRSRRGIPNRPVHLLGFADYISNFGGHTAAHSSHVVQGFFRNGGTEGYATRIVGTGTRAASTMLLDVGAAPTVLVQAGMKGVADPGVWGNDLSVAVTPNSLGASNVPAQIISANTELFALADLMDLQVTVNGAPEVVTFNDGADFQDIANARADEVAAVINRESSIIRASVTDDLRILLASTVTGPVSRLVVAGAAAAPLGFAGPTANSDGALLAGTTRARLESVGGFSAQSALVFETAAHTVATGPVPAALTEDAAMDVTVTDPDGTVRTTTVSFTDADFVGPTVAGSMTITAGEVVAAINRQADGFTAELNHQGSIVLMTSSYGNGAAIALAVIGGGIPDAIAPLLFGGAMVAGLTENHATSNVAERQKLVTWVGGLAVAMPTMVTRIRTAEFDLEVFTAGEPEPRERYEALSKQPGHHRYVENIVNDQIAGSRYIRVTDQVANLNIPVRNPAATGPAYRLGEIAGTGGNDGAAPIDNNYIGRADLRTGFFSFETVAVQLIACPETTSQAVVGAGLAYCEQRGDAMFIGSPPQGYDRDAIKIYASAFRARKVYGAMYGPWIQIVNPTDTTGNNPRMWLPPVGHVMGMFARIADQGVWQSPAGGKARLRFALDVEFEMNDVEHTDLVKSGGVNGIRPIPGEGIVVDASRTLSTDTRWLFVNVRRLFNFVKSSLRDGLRWVPQEPHDQELRDKVRFNSVRPFLLGLWRRGAFGSEPADTVFTIKCDAENNPPADVNVGLFTIEIYFYAVRPAETIVIKVGQQDSRATATEA